ncbi:hypothetical protein SOPP22_07625 [Shewanella sp. OPT22]|nr:hypothetical protein SOPP22_07625 [Shewanella sp. OPT22]
MIFGLGLIGAAICLYCHIMSNKNYISGANTMLSSEKDKLALFNFSYIVVLHVITGAVLAVAAFDVISKMHIFGLMSFISLLYLLFFVWRSYLGFVVGQPYKKLDYLEMLGFLITGLSAVGGLYFVK